MPKDAIAREAACILRLLIEGTSLVAERGGFVELEAKVSMQLFDRLCVWGTEIEDCEEDDPPEDSGDAEPELAI